MHARITVQLLPHNPLDCGGGQSITDDGIADAVREILDHHQRCGDASASPREHVAVRHAANAIATS